MIVRTKEESYLEVSWWDSWKEMLFALELRTQKTQVGRVWTFGLTVLYRVLFFIEYTRFNEKSRAERKNRLTESS
jgi:hypothetical protein